MRLWANWLKKEAIISLESEVTWISQLRFGWSKCVVGKNCGLRHGEMRSGRIKVRSRTKWRWLLRSAKCRVCAHEDNCRSWCLKASQLLPPSFCPNANFFRACRQPPLNGHATLNSNTLVKRWEQAPNASFEQQASGELLKLIWKLRWLGEDDDANKARTQLNRILARLPVLGGVPCAAITFGIPNDTD